MADNKDITVNGALLAEENGDTGREKHSDDNKDCLTKFKKTIKDNLFMITTIIGVIVGFIIGFVARIYQPSSTAILWIAMPGDLFIRLLKMTILPLIAANVIVVTASLDPKVNGKISLVAFGYIIVANVFCAILGSSCSLIIKPGAFTLSNSTAVVEKKVSKLTTSDVFADLLYNIFPDNLVGASIYKSQTVYNEVKRLNKTSNETLVGYERSVINSESVNMIGVLFLSFIFGMSARICGKEGEAFLAFFKSLAQVVMTIMRWFLWLTPIGVCFMIAGSIAELQNVGDTLSSLGFFILTVTVGLGIHFIVSNAALLIVSRKNPLVVVPPSLRSWFISFATTAPVIAIPEMYVCCDKLNIPKSVSRFVVPFAAALKGDGSAVFVSSAAVFIGQLTGEFMNAGTIVIIILLTASAMMALPNIPSSSIVILITVLSSVGVDTTQVGLLFAVEWLLDRMRSGMIGLSHIYCTSFVYYACKNDIDQSAEENNLENASLNGAANVPDVELDDMTFLKENGSPVV